MTDQKAAPEFIPLTFGVEALFPPMAMIGSQVRQVYMKLAEPCRFNEFRQLGEGQGARMAEGTNRHLTLANDRVVYRDDMTRATFSGFCDDFRLIFQTLREQLRIPVLLHTKVLMRTLMPHNGNLKTNESIEKLLVPAAGEQIRHFQRPSSGVGFRFVFPPTNEHHSTFNIRIEPYYRDMKLFFLENSAQFFDPVTEYNLMEGYFHSAYTFLQSEAGSYILSITSNPESR